MSISGKKILILGGTGSLGRSLIRRESRNNQLLVVSRDEAKHWTLRNRLSSEENVQFIVGDIRDSFRVENIIRETEPQIIILAAALKQVDTCERTPYESIQTNVLGICNVIDSVLKLEKESPSLETVLMVSTDKACSPTNVYGMSKAISERVVTSALSKTGRIKFVGVRYGNVLESRGSIIPLYRFQAEKGLELTVTHEQMTRFIMTLDESIDLIEDTILNATTGEIWLPKLRSMRILDLAEIFRDKFGVGIKVTGIRPGEKMHEELVSETESLRVKDSGMYLRMTPSLNEVPKEITPFVYSSRDRLMSKYELNNYLSKLNILNEDLSNFPGREIEEISILRGNQ